MIYINQEALRITTNAYYAYANGTHFSVKDLEELNQLILELNNIKVELVKYTKELQK